MIQALRCLYEWLEPANTLEIVDIRKRDLDVKYSKWVYLLLLLKASFYLWEWRENSSTVEELLPVRWSTTIGVNVFIHSLMVFYR